MKNSILKVEIRTVVKQFPFEKNDNCSRHRNKVANRIPQSTGITSKTKVTLRLCTYKTAAWQVKTAPVSLAPSIVQVLVSLAFLFKSLKL